ncbi:peptide ABC transporter permease [Erysipelothrix larvae]|uniref:Peptide ABC transporter permease n=1 Tax=Erysipelothrix larvae TaxID=1514105 RepID=A0A109UGS7_9FIRM|nr:ABC transporter permease subunit [Erysipelothrix larvae]AMC93148.1 peptide ABC transporter permease [Erysipelothrix larvae]
MSEKKKKTSFLKTITSLFLPGGRKDNFDDVIVSPTQQIARNFFENKLGVIGLVGFILLFSLVFISTSLDTGYNPYNHETTLANLGPSTSYLKIDKSLNGSNVDKIVSGVSFSVALDTDGKLHFWGNNPASNVNVEQIVELTKDKTIVDIAAGSRHIIALTNTGDIIGAGENNFNEASFPSEVKQSLMGDTIKKIDAGVSVSVILTGKGRVIVWGSTLANNLDTIPNSVQGEIADVTVAPFNLVLTMKDGTITTLGVRSNEVAAVSPELAAGEYNIVQTVVSENTVIALDDQGVVHSWGAYGEGRNVIPEFDAKIVEIYSTRSTFLALDENGTLYTWGADRFGLLNIPSNVSAKNVETVFANFFSVYAVNDDDSITAWGHGGFRFGSDSLGRDMGERLLHGGRISLTVGAVSVLISLIIGVIVGLISGFYGGWLDNLLMRIAEVINSFPFLPLAITLSAFLPPSISENQRLTLIMVILGILSWPGMARLVRGQILAEREKDFVLAARALGLKENVIIIKHILPSVFSMIIVNMTLGYASSLLTEAGLSYLGFGVKPPSPSWGNMLSGVISSVVIERYWWQWVLPAGCVLLAALTVNLIGDALRDAIDPRANQK